MNKSSSDNPFVSVCVQTYMHEKLIGECLNSILNQKTDFHFEIVVGEDESSDRTRIICEQFQRNNPDKIRLFLRSRQNVIYVNNKPTGRYNFIENLKVCRGKYIALCPGDDYWTDPYKLQKQVDFLEKNPKYSIHAGNIIHVDESNNPIEDTWPDLNCDIKFDKYSLGSEFKCPTMTIMFPSSNIFNRLKLLDDKYPYGDLVLIHLLLLEGSAFVSKDVYSAYRHHSTAIFSKNNLKTKIKNGLITRELLYKNLKPELNLFQRLIFLLNVYRFKKKYRDYLN